MCRGRFAQRRSRCRNEPALRPVVAPEAGNAIGEVDLSQIEVGIAAAVYNDGELIRMFNGQDVYVAMAKRFFADELTPDQLRLPDKRFKRQCAAYRKKMKVTSRVSARSARPSMTPTPATGNETTGSLRRQIAAGLARRTR